MRRESVPSAEVDACDACGAMWLDWFDGEIHILAAQAEAARIRRGTPPPSMQPVRTGGSGACPRCMQPLALELYRFSDASDDELIAGVELLRCSECAGSFVPRSSAHLLLDRQRTPRRPTSWEALVGFVRRLVRPSH